MGEADKEEQARVHAMLSEGELCASADKMELTQSGHEDSKAKPTETSVDERIRLKERT